MHHESSFPARAARSSTIRAVGAALLFGALAVTTSAAHAGPYSAEVVFGDSLSDNGNLAEALYQQNFPNPPSYHDSFTNGPVAAQLLAQQLGVSYAPSLWLTSFHDVFNLFGGAAYTPGTNYAVAAATAAAAPVGGVPGINLPFQVGAYLSHAGAADPNALYVVDIGGNDVRNAALQGTGSAAVQNGVATELAALQALIDNGAKNLFVVNVPNVGVIPEFAQDNPTLAAAATSYSQQYDALLGAGLGALSQSGVRITQFDLFAFNTNVLSNPAAYGLTNTTDRCYTDTPLSAATTAACGPNAENIDQFAYWDAIHPTETVQALWASGFIAALNVPEPSTVALFGLGLLGAIGGLRRRGRG